MITGNALSSLRGTSRTARRFETFIQAALKHMATRKIKKETMSAGGCLHVLVLGVEPQSLINFRKDLIAELKAGGHRVTVAAQGYSAAQRNVLEGLGAEIKTASFSRTGMNPFRDLNTLASLVGLFRKSRPDIVIAYTAKPVIYGALAARMAGVPRFAAMITGLGYSFVAGSGLKRRVARGFATRLYRIALKRCSAVIFQNPDDRATFAELGLLKGAGTVGIVNGSGVDLQHFQVCPLPLKPVFLMVARLLADKGIREYAEAAFKLRKAMPEVRTLLVGGLDPSPNSVKEKELDGWVAGGLEYLGPLNDVRPAFAEASVVVLPSYREGTPRSVLEGMAMGRAIITTDVPGCRETVKAGLNGILVPPRNSEALLSAMMKLVGKEGVVENMGLASRQIAEERYEGKSVARETMRLAGLGQVVPVKSKRGYGLKRPLDFAIAFVMLCLLIPLIALLAMIIIVNSGRPALFVQQRVGRFQQNFLCYKLRTMANTTKNLPSHMVDKAAITGIGRYLRKYKLDELPQLFNVLKGNMSFVGPRPCLPQQTILVEARQARGIFELPPGITGLAQINHIDMSNPMKLAECDARYLERQSMLLDLKILLATFLGKGLRSDAAIKAPDKGIQG